MANEQLLHTARDPERDPRLTALLAMEFGTTTWEAAERAHRVLLEVARQSTGFRAGWTVISTWSRTVVRVGAGLAAAASLMLLRAPADVGARLPTSSSEVAPDRADAVVAILTTRATSSDVVATFMPSVPDDLLTAAVRR